jgi:uncharacterized protein YdaU (DUF1376 family)
MSERPFMQLFVSDFVGDTLQLSTEQVGAYLLLLMALWNADGALPDDPAKLSRVARVPVESWPSVWSDLASYFTVSGGKVTQERLSRELARFARKSAARSDAGRRGAAAKSLKANGRGKAIATPLLKHSSEPEKKAGRFASDPTEGPVTLDRWQGGQEALFEACEEITGTKIPEFVQRYQWPADIVAQARAKLAVH